MARGDAEMDDQQSLSAWEQVDLLSLVGGPAQTKPEPADEPVSAIESVPEPPARSEQASEQIGRAHV